MSSPRQLLLSFFLPCPERVSFHSFLLHTILALTILINPEFSHFSSSSPSLGPTSTSPPSSPLRARIPSQCLPSILHNPFEFQGLPPHPPQNSLIFLRPRTPRP